MELTSWIKTIQFFLIEKVKFPLIEITFYEKWLKFNISLTASRKHTGNLEMAADAAEVHICQENVFVNKEH